MTVKEAIIELNKRIRIWNAQNEGHRKSWGSKSMHATSGISAAKLAISALEKQIPKKPEIEYARNAQNEKIIEFGICPECEEELDYTHVKQTYCPRCGQAIDWS